MKHTRLERVKLDKIPSTLSGLFDAFDQDLSMKEANRFYDLLYETLISAINVPTVAKMLPKYQESVAKSLLKTAECINKGFDADQADELRQLLYTMIGLSPTANGLWNNSEEARHNRVAARPVDPRLWLTISGEVLTRRGANYQMLDRLTRRVDDETQGYHEKMQGITSQKE